MANNRKMSEHIPIIDAIDMGKEVRDQENEQEQEAGDAVSHARILIVDDNSTHADLLCWTLKLEGYCPIAITGIRAAQTWIRDLGSFEKIALVLLDVSGPLEEAVTFLQYLCGQFTAVQRVMPPLIIFTTHAESRDELVETGYPVFTKPFHVQALLAEVQKILPSPQKS